MLKALAFTCVLGSALAAANSTTNGLTFSADVSMFQQAEEAYWHAIQSRINSIVLPDVVDPNDAANYLKQNDFTVTQPTDHITFTADAADNCLTVKLNKLSAKFTSANFHGHYGIFGAYGDLTMSIDTTKLVFGYRLVLQTLEDGRSVPAVEPCGYDFSAFDKGDISVSVHGSFWDGFIDMFKSLFEGKIVDAIKGAVQKELTVALPADLNAMFASNDGFAEIPHFANWWLDLASSEPGTVSETSIEAGIRAIMFDHRSNETIPEQPVMPYKDPAIPSALQAFVSAASVNSALSSFLQVHPVDGFFNASMVPPTAGFNLTTGFLEKAFSGISEVYGPDAPVDVEYSLTNVYGFAVSESQPDLTLEADADLKFWVHTANGTELAADLSLSQFTFAGQLKIEDGYNLNMTIKQLKLKDISVNACTFGHVGTFKLKMGLNVALAVAAPAIAQKVSTVELPESPIKYLNLSDYTIAYYNGFLGIGATPIFNPPPLPPAPAGTPYASRVCVRNEAGFVLNWQFKDKYSKERSDFTDTYPIGQTKCMNIDDALPKVKEGEQIQTFVHASGGDTNKVEHLIVYTGEEVATINYTCKGTTLNFSCTDDALHSNTEFLQ